MAANLIQDGARVTATIAANVTSGVLYTLGGGVETTANGLPAIAGIDGVTGDSVDFLVEGVFSVAKIAEANSDLAVGDLVYSRTVTGVQEVTGVSGSANAVIGTAWAAAVTGATTAIVKLVGNNSGV